MNCVIPVEQLRKFRVKIGKDIQSVLDAEGAAPFDLKNFLSNLYSEILTKSGDKDLALDYIKVAPLFIDQVTSSDDVITSKLLDQNFDFNILKRQILNFNSDNGIQQAIDYLGIENNIADELEDLQNIVVEEPEKEIPLPSNGNNVFGPMQNVDINGDPIVLQRNGIFSAFALNFLSDSEWETYSIKPGEKGYNVVDPVKKFYFDVKRSILDSMRGLENGSEMNFKGAGPIFLKAVEVSTLESKDKKQLSESDKIGQAEIDKAIAMVVVDKNGNMLRFNSSTGELATDGIPAYFYMRNTDRFMKNGKIELDQYEKERASAISKNLGITSTEAEEFMKRQIGFVASIRQYIKQNPQENNVTLNITGGSHGFPNYDFRVKTPLKNISDEFTMDIEKGFGGLFKNGSFYIKIDGITGMPLKTDAPFLKDTPYLDILITLLTEDVYDMNGNLLSITDKNKFINTYLYTHKERASLSPNGRLTLRGEVLSVATPELKAAAQAKLRTYFSELTEVKTISPENIGDRTVVPFRSSYKLNNVTKDENGQYWVIENIKLNGQARLNSNFDDVTGFVTDNQGRLVVQTTNRPFNDFIKEHWTTPYILNDNNQVVKVQSYLTYDVTPEDMSKLDTKAKAKEVSEKTGETGSTFTPVSGDKFVLTKNEYTTPEDVYQEIKQNGEGNFKKMYKVLFNAIQNGSVSTENARKVLELWNERQKTEGEPQLTSNQYNALNKIITGDEAQEFEKPKVEQSEDVNVEITEETIKEDPPINPAEIPYTDNTNTSGFNLLDWLDENANDPTLQKNWDQKKMNIQATKEQVEAAKTWYETLEIIDRNGKKVKLNDIFPYQAAFNMVNTNDPNSVATWAMHGIRLYQGSDFSDLYHEAYHGFSQAYMSPEQRKDVYGAVRKLKGTFVDHTGKNQQFATANDLQVEEYLAEGFRNYMLSGGKKVTPSAKVNSFFQVLLNILDALFGNLTFNEVFTEQSANDKINNIYEKLRVGNLTQYSFNESNPSFTSLNSGIQAAEDSGEVRTELSYEDSADIMDMIDSFGSDAIDLNNTLTPLTPEERQEYLNLQAQVGAGGLEGVELANAQAKLDTYNNNPNKTNSFTSSMVNTVNGRKQIFKYAYAQFGSLWHALSERYNKETEPAIKAHLGKKIETLRWVLNKKNFGDMENLANNMPDENGAVKGVIGYYMQKSKRFLEDISEQIYGAEANTEEEIMLKGREVNSLSNEHSSQDLAKKDILFLLKSLHDVGDDSKPVYNEYGAKKLADFSEAWNKVAVTLENNLDPAVMYTRLQELSESYPPVKQLLSKIGSPTRSHITDSGQTLWSHFVSAFNLTRAPLLQMTIEKTKNDKGQITYTSKIGVTFGSFKAIGRTWESEFQRTFTNPFIKSDDEGNYLDTDALLAKYPTAQSVEGKEVAFLNDLGITMTDNPVIKQLLYDGDSKLGVKPKLAERFYNVLVEVNGFQKKSKDAPLIIRSINDIVKEYPEFGKKANENGRLKTLQEIELQFGDERSNFMVQNAEGNTQFEHMLNNTLSMIVNAVNAAKTYQELVALPHMSYLDISRNPNAKYSTMLNSIFMMDEQGNNFGKRRQFDGKDVKLNFNNLSGAALYDLEGETDTGVAAAKADEFSKFIMDFHMANNPNSFVSEMMRHSDKSTSFATVLSKIFGLGTGNAGQNTYVEIDDFIENDNDPNRIKTHVNSTFKYIQNYLYAEHERIKHMEAKQKEVDEIKKKIKNNEVDANGNPYEMPELDYGYLNQGQKFQVFDDIFDGQLKADLLKIDNLKEVFDKGLDLDLRKRVYDAVADYFKKQSDSVESKFMEAEFIAGSLESMMQKKFGEKKVQITRPAMRRALVESMVANMWIHNVETVNMFYGDLAMYNHAKQEFHKRNAGIGSTGTVFRTDASMLDYINGRVRRGYAEKLGYKHVEYNGQLNTAIIQDIDSRSAIYDEIADSQRDAFVKQFKKGDPTLTDKAAIERANIKLFGEKGTQAEPGKDGIMYGYAHMNEADAQGYLTFDMYRIMAISQGEWDFNTQEKTYQAIINGENIDQTQMSDLFPPAKYQYWGPLATSDIPVMAFHKYSLAPIIPGTYKEGSNMDKLHKMMMTQNVDYLTFQSGSKVGTITKGGKADNFYNANTRSINENTVFTKNVIYANYLKNQLKIHNHFKESITFPTQLRKLIEDGLMEFGVPVDYETGLSVDERIKSWEGLSQEAKMQNQNYRLVKTYEDHISELTEMKKQKLLQKMGLKEENGVISGDQTKLWNFVKNELQRQDLADHEIDFIKVVNGKLQYDLSMSLSAEKIEKLLNAIITRTLIKQKFHGEGLYQLASAMFEGQESTQRFTNPTEADLELWGTNDLPTYRIRNGKVTAAKVKIALQGDFEYLFYLNDKDGKQIAVKNEDGTLDYNASLDRLNELLRDDAWLDVEDHRSMITMVGVRIPTQGLNSMEFMEVYQFLPKTASNVIILPAEIVAKSGADFDIDKLTVLMPNLSKSYKTDVTNDALKQLQTANPQLDFSRKNVGRIINAMKNDEEESFSPEDKKVAKAIEQFTTTEVKYKTDKSEKGLENNIITDIKNILALPENYASLTRPNGTDILDPIQEELGQYVNKYNPSFTYQSDNKVKEGQISPTRVLEIEYNLYKHYTNNIGKQTLGLGAVDNTFNTLLTRINAYMNPVDGNGVRQELYLPHNSIQVKGQDAISLASIMDKNGEFRISDIINQMINGWVDIAKKAWIFNIQGNKEISPTLLFMIQAGVPVEQAVYFVSTPAVREYVERQKKFKSTYSEALGYGNDRTFAKINAANSVLVSLGFDVPEDMSLDEFVNIEMWSTGIKDFNKDKIKAIVQENKPVSNETSSLEKTAFLHFLQVQKMATAVRDVKLRMNLDTAESKSLFEASDRLDLIAQLRQDGKMNSNLVDSLLKDSPIGSFAIQDFQLRVWKDAFPLRNHPVFNKFIGDNLSIDLIDNTLGDKEKVVAAIKNDLMSYIFQNSFNTTALTIDGIDNIKAYRGYDVANNQQRSTLVKENPESLRFGAFMQDNVMYIDKNRIITDFIEKGYTTKSTRYKSNLLATVDENAFTTIDEYTKFVLEREYLRGTLDLNALKETPEFLDLLKMSEEGEWYPQRDAESGEVYKSRVNRNIIEMILRDKALDNSFNQWKLFQSPNTYAHQFARIKNDFPSLVENFPLLKYFVISKNDKNYTNIKLVDIQLDGDMLNRIHQMFIKLTHPQELGIEEGRDAQKVADFFRKFPIIGYMQSGLSSRGQFATGRYIPEEIIVGLMNEPVKKFKKHLDSFINAKGTPLILQDFLRLWRRENNKKNFSTMSRGKNFKSDIKLENSINFGNTVSDIMKISNYIGEISEIKITESFKIDGMVVNAVPNNMVKQAYTTVIDSLTLDEINKYRELKFLKPMENITDAKTYVSNELYFLFDGGDSYVSNLAYQLSNEGYNLLIEDALFNHDGIIEDAIADVEFVMKIAKSTLQTLSPMANEAANQELASSEPVADIPQNKVSGIESYGSTVTANDDVIKVLGSNPHSIDMIEVGMRTRTTRSANEMEKYGIKVGDVIKHYGKSADDTTKTVYAKVTAIHSKGSSGWKGTWAKEGWRADEVNVIDRFTDGAAAIEFEVITSPFELINTNSTSQQSTTGTNKPSNFKNFSGGQTDGSITKGGDTAWYETGKDFGVENHTFYKPQDFDALSDDAKSQLNTQYTEVVSFLGRGILRPETTAGKLVRRDMMQANSADAIYGVTTLIAPGKTDRSGKYPNRKAYITPDGGTGYALARGILSNKPVYVYNQSNSQGVETGWYKWENGNFVATAVPVLTKNFAGVGTRELNAEGKQAIKDVYANTFKQSTTEPTQPSTSVKIEPTDKIIWGHPGLGKTTFRKQNSDKVLDFDTDFKPVIAEILGLPVDEQNSVGLNKWRKENGDEEFNKVMRKVWAIAKNMAKEENKILVVSDMIFLRENASDFDKVITTSKEAFVKRATERGDDAKSLESWKSSIDKTIAGIDKSKVISTDKYLSDLLATQSVGEIKPGVVELFESNSKLSIIGTPQQYSQYLDTVFPNREMKDIVYRTESKTKGSEFSIFKKGKEDTLFDLGFYFTTKKGAEDLLSINKAAHEENGIQDEYDIRIFRYILNFKNPQTKSFKKYFESNPTKSFKHYREDVNEAIQNGYDSLIATNVIDWSNENQYIAFEPEQIHELGGKQDIEGFKNFVTQSSTSVEREYTPENITSLKPNEVFVFGSNAEGAHGKGAALLAKTKFGAIQGQSEGLQGQSYAIITKKNWRVEKSSTLTEIGNAIMDFVSFAKQNPQKKFYVTKIASSLAGYTVEEIADLWKEVNRVWEYDMFDDIPDNIILPKEYEMRDKSTQSSTNLPGSEIKINIYAGTGENAELSNFANRPFKSVVTTHGTFNTVEGAFQAAKFRYSSMGVGDRLTIILELMNTTGAKAKALGRTITGLDTKAWDENSSRIMKELLKESFEQNPNALAKLLATGNATLTHTQDKGKWGTEFPKLLMEVRNELRTSQLSTKSVQPTSQATFDIKPNVDFVFEQSPEMAIIGTQEQYSRYLDMVWPKSGVKQILFRGSQNPNKLEASDLDPEKGTGAKNLGKGIYLAKDKAFADKYSAPGGRTTAFIVNVPDFYITSIQKNWDRGYATPSDLTVREITGNTSDTLISFEGFDKDNYIDTDNRATGKYVGGLDENGFPVYQEMNMVTPQWTQMAVQSNAQILPLGSDQDKAQFQAFVLDENSPTKSLDSFTSVEDLQKNPTFENMTIEFVNEIKTNKDKPVAMRALKGQNKILMVSNLMYDKYTEKAWTKPATQADGSKATPLAENQFGTFNEFLTFALLHEKAHTYILKTKNENTGEYEDRINNEAQRRLDEIPNKEVKNERVVAPEQVVVTDEMIQDFMFNVCK